MKSIVLQGKRGAGLVALVSDEDYERFASDPWYSGGSDERHYATRSGDLAAMHRLIAAPLPGQLVDHINGNTLDNRRENLRVCSPSQNNGNRGPNVGRQFKGVIRHHSGNWYARIGYEGRTHCIGVYATAIEAAQAYNNKATELFGAFALLNDVPEGIPAHICDSVPVCACGSKIRTGSAVCFICRKKQRRAR